MRRKNWRVVLAGGLLVVLALGFFLFMMTMASTKSNDPAQMMHIVGQASGGAGGLGVVMILFGLVGTKQKA